jgi:hypothetical protein
MMIVIGNKILVKGRLFYQANKILVVSCSCCNLLVVAHIVIFRFPTISPLQFAPVMPERLYVKRNLIASESIE